MFKCVFVRNRLFPVHLVGLFYVFGNVKDHGSHSLIPASGHINPALHSSNILFVHSENCNNKFIFRFIIIEKGKILILGKNMDFLLKCNV